MMSMGNTNPPAYSPNPQFMQMRQQCSSYTVASHVTPSMLKHNLPTVYRQFDRDCNGLDYAEYFRCVYSVF